jgi:RimJ/RimL family protein N-acetyltransferase
VIVTTPQDALVMALCKEIGLAPSPDIRCIGSVTDDNMRLLGVVGFDGYNGASVMMHVFGKGNWISRDLLKVSFDYPFNHLKCNLVMGLVPSGNEEALRLNRHLGFKVETVLEGAHPDGALILMVMRKEDCRWLKMKHRKPDGESLH